MRDIFTKGHKLTWHYILWLEFFVLTFGVFFFYRPYTESVSICQSTSYDNLTLSRDKPHLENSNIYYDHGHDSRILTIGEYFEPYMEIIPGPATCLHGNNVVLCFDIPVVNRVKVVILSSVTM